MYVCLTYLAVSISSNNTSQTIGNIYTKEIKPRRKQLNSDQNGEEWYFSI